MDPARWQRRSRRRPKLVWLEAPGSVTMEFPDLPALVARRRGAASWIALDNTWGAGIAFDRLRSDPKALDISMHALTGSRAAAATC